MTAVTAILLAAGASSRMGSVKALLPVEGQPAICHLAKEFLKVCKHCVVVTGFHHEEVEVAVSGIPGVCVARNPEPERGQLSSLQTGLRALRTDQAEWFLFAPVDCMGIEQELLLSLMEAIDMAPTDTLLCMPQFGDRRGHPVAARMALVPEFLTLGPAESARAITHRLRASTLFVSAKNDRFLLDVDRPEDYARFLATRLEVS